MHLGVVLPADLVVRPLVPPRGVRGLAEDPLLLVEGDTSPSVQYSTVQYITRVARPTGLFKLTSVTNSALNVYLGTVMEHVIIPYICHIFFVTLLRS